MRYIILFLLPLVSLANVDITEVMFDPEGTDSGREWIEIYNKSDEDIDLSTWKLLENDINHGISGDNSILPAGQYAVISDNVDKFKVDYPTYSGILLDSAFGLVNTGESIALLDSDGNQYAYLEYDVEIGGKGNGNTISLNADGVYVENIATPGVVNTISDVSVDNVDTKSSTHSSPKELSDQKKKVELKIGAGRDRVATINTQVKFDAILNTDVSDRKIRWSFGDGHAKSRKKVSHSYEFPGKYVVVVRGDNDGEEAVSRTTVTVFKPEIGVIEVNNNEGYIVLENTGSMEVNLGGFKIKGPDLSFRFPRDTILSPKSQLYLSFKTLWYMSELPNLTTDNVWIEYPEGGVVTGN